ncbi:MFS transporter [Acidovorax sp. CCYZU-2555]|uniref:MFS transporter n=1 Tax=Acidovorax sp. CCYZU-2555 TaxID=2835042 RepID=UPI001BCCB448|nr:MFS transporter [Acidovorax sp. CCYZU-2555]MBS7779452.1 MFS transporter [Acidovorax sp. CCYZU-2555]
MSGVDAPQSGWLALLCITRLFQATIAIAWAGVMPRVMADWDLAASQAGLVQSAWHVGYLISLFGVGFIADRVGPRRVFLVSSILTACAALVFALGAQGPASAALLYGITGLCAGGCYSPGLQLLALNAPAQRRGKAMGAFIGSASFGYGVALVAVAALADSLSWRSILLVIAVMVAVGAVLTVAALSRLRPDPQRGAAPRSSSIRLALVETVGDKPAMAGSWAYSAHCWELMALWAWLPAFLAFSAQGGGLSAAEGIGLAAMAHLVSVAGSVFGGSASDRYGRVRVMLVASCLSLLCSFTFGWMWAAPLWMLAAFGAVYNLWAIADSSVYSTALADVVPPGRLGAAYSVRSVMGFGAGAVSPWVFGLALDWGRAHFALEGNAWVLAWTTVGLGALLGPWMILRFQRLTAAGGRP